MEYVDAISQAASEFARLWHTDHEFRSRRLSEQMAAIYPSWTIVETHRDLATAWFLLHRADSWLAVPVTVAPASLRDVERAWAATDSTTREAALALSVLARSVHAGDLATLLTRLSGGGDRSARFAGYVATRGWLGADVRTLIALGGCGLSARVS